MKKFVIFLNLYQSLAFIKAKLFGYRSLGFVKLLCCFVLFAISLYTLHIIERQSIFHSVAFAQFDIDFSNWSGSDDSSPPGGCDGGSDVCGGGESKPTQPSQPQNDSPLGGWDLCSFLPCGGDTGQTSNKSSTNSSAEQKSRQTFCDIFGIGCGGDDTQTADKQVGSGSKAPGPGAQSGGCYLGFICPDAKGQYCFAGLCTPTTPTQPTGQGQGSATAGTTKSYNWTSLDCQNDPECQGIWNDVCKYQGVCGVGKDVSKSPLEKCLQDPECSKNEELIKKIKDLETKKNGTATTIPTPAAGTKWPSGASCDSSNPLGCYCNQVNNCDSDPRIALPKPKNSDDFWNFCRANPGYGGACDNDPQKASQGTMPTIGQGCAKGSSPECQCNEAGGCKFIPKDAVKCSDQDDPSCGSCVAGFGCYKGTGTKGTGGNGSIGGNGYSCGNETCIIDPATGIPTNKSFQMNTTKDGKSGVLACSGGDGGGDTCRFGTGDPFQVPADQKKRAEDLEKKGYTAPSKGSGGADTGGGCPAGTTHCPTLQ